MNLFSNRIVSVIAILIITSQPSLLIAQNVNAEHDSIQSKYSGSPVNPFGETIFVVKARLGPLSVENRAKTITGIIKRLAEDPFFTTDSLLIVHDDNNVDVIYRGQVITTVTENDVRAENKPAEFIAHERHKQISEALNKFIEHNSDAGILKSFIFSGIVLILLILLVYLVNKLHHFIDKRIHQAKAGPLAKIKIRDYQLIPLHRQIRLLHITNVFFRYGLIVLMFFTALWLTSYFLPWTKAYSLIFLGFILEPLKDFLNTLWFFIPNLLTIIVIVFITTLILRFFRFMRTEIEKGAIKISGFYPEWALPVFNIIRFLIWAFSIILIYPHLPGSDSKVFQGMSVFIGLLVSLTSASILGNLVAGFALTFTRAFQIGDRIRVGENVGDVIEKTMAVTKIRTIKNEIITIPNSKIQSSEVVNYSTLAGESGLIIHTTVTIGYDAPWRQVHQLLIDAAKATDLLMLSPEPFVLQNGLDDFYVSYQINAYTRNASKMAVILSDLHKNIQESFNNSGVEIMSPHYRALRDGNRIAMPDDHLPDSYTRPSFGVNLNKE
ncbi:MAG: mechanosensitive ion channel family protein [Bacteroidales bacterium]